jgi:peroxiredoxin
MDVKKSFPLPDDLPEPEDDGEADHLPGTTVPSVTVPATDGTMVDLSELSGRIVVYCYPKTGRPDKDVIPDGWDDIPGAQGCTPESCGFRDHYRELQDRGVTEVFGLSVQSSEYQSEARDRLELPFELLSDPSLELTNRLQLPTFEVTDDTLLKRLTLVLSDARVEHVFYPVFPPDEHADEVVDWLEADLLG